MFRDRSGEERTVYQSGEECQALLRCGVVSAARRLAMKAARRVPRAQGMTVSFSAAALVIDLMKRALVFMALVLDISLLWGAALA